MNDQTHGATPGPDQRERNDFRGRISGQLRPVDLVQDKVFIVH